MSILTLLLPLITQVVGRIIPDTAQASQVEVELQKAILERQEQLDMAFAEAVKAQAQVNLAEAQSSNLFVSGWRPAVGWICAASCAYSFIFQPTATWIASAFGASAFFPTLDTNALMTLLFGMLGIAGLRTTEKILASK